MIGLGTQDDGAMAVEFVRDQAVHSFPMYWDETAGSWIHFGVTSQPSAVLLAPDGQVLGSWRGMFDVDEVLVLADASADQG